LAVIDEETGEDALDKSVGSAAAPYGNGAAVALVDALAIPFSPATIAIGESNGRRE